MDKAASEAVPTLSKPNNLWACQETILLSDSKISGISGNLWNHVGSSARNDNTQVAAI